jgi:hypothetical protein
MIRAHYNFVPQQRANLNKPLKKRPTCFVALDRLTELDSGSWQRATITNILII